MTSEAYSPGIPTVSSRLARLPKYPFARLAELKSRAVAAGVDVIDLGLGNPDGVPAPAVLATMAETMSDRGVHGYPPFPGRDDFKKAAAGWIKRRYAVDVDWRAEVLALTGSKEGLAHICMAYLDPGDLALVPSPCYPVHNSGPVLAGATVFPLPLFAEKNFLPDFSLVPDDVARAARILILNYPNNPTAATAPDSLFQEAIAFCQRHGILLVHDLAYGEIYFGPGRPRSLLEFAGGREVGVEFHTLSKSFNMAGWRIGFVTGNAAVIENLSLLKTHIDYGVFGAVQKAAITAFNLPDSELDKQRDIYRRRRDLLVSELSSTPFAVEPPQATMYIWLRLPGSLNLDSVEFVEMLVERAGVVLTPGRAFGQGGEGYARLSLVSSEDRLQEAARRIKALKID